MSYQIDSYGMLVVFVQVIHILLNNGSKNKFSDAGNSDMPK